MIMSNNNGNDDNVGTVGAAADTATTIPLPSPNETTVATRNDPGPTSGNNNDRNGGGSSGGRIPMGGRALLMGRTTTNAAGRSSSSSYGRGPPSRDRPMTVHAHSGVPFGHVPAYLPGASSLVEELDQRILLVLRDGKHIIGVSL